MKQTKVMCYSKAHIFENDNKKPQLYSEWHSFLSHMHIVKENKTTESILVLCNKMSAGRRISSLALFVHRPSWSIKCSGEQIGNFLNNIDCNFDNIIFSQSLRNVVLHRETFINCGPKPPKQTGRVHLTNTVLTTEWILKV